MFISKGNTSHNGGVPFPLKLYWMFFSQFLFPIHMLICGLKVKTMIHFLAMFRHAYACIFIVNVRTWQ